MRRSAEICDWEFSVPALAYSKNVRLPHTWNIVNGTMNYRGEGIYTAFCKLCIGCAWKTGKYIEEQIRKTAKRCQDKPLIISEFGLCEPAFEGGDKRRSEILAQRISIHRQIPNISGYIWFSLNDYRAQYGEYGEG